MMTAAANNFQGEFMNESLIFQETPDLVNPYLFIGYRGWLNAGVLGTGSI